MGGQRKPASFGAPAKEAAALRTSGVRPPDSSPSASGSGRIEGIDLAWAGLCGLLTTLAAAILSTVVFGRIPHVQDSVAQLFQARIFARGHLWMPSPPLREFFDYAHMINDGRWFSQYPPGHPLLLVPGVWLGIPWLVNPVLGGLGVAATFLLALELFDRATARAAGVLGILSPFLVLMASEFMAHVSGYCLLTFYLFFQFRALRTGRQRDGLAAGLCLLLAILVRPYTAFAMALPALAYAAWRLYKDPARLGRPAVWVLAGGAAGGLLLALYNWGTTGNPMVPGYIKLYGPSHGLGFGKGSWGPPHTLLRGLKGAWSSVRSLNTRLFEWPVSSLWPLVAALLPSAGRDAAPLGRRWLLIAFPAALLLAYVFYWYRDLCFGPRYVYEALGPVLVLTALGLLRTGRWLGSLRILRMRGRGRALPGLVLTLGLFVYAGAAGWPPLFRPPRPVAGLAADDPVRMGSHFQFFGPAFWGVSPYLGRLVEERGLHRALVFCRFAEPEGGDLMFRYIWFGSAFAHEEPDPERAEVIYARDRGPENERLIRLYPGRRVYLYTGSIQGGMLQEVVGMGPREPRPPGSQSLGPGLYRGAEGKSHESES